MKFRLLEKVLDAFKDGGMHYIYVNPTSQELRSKEDSKGNRGVIDKNGDLYMEAAWTENKNDYSYTVWSHWIHDDLLEHLHQRGKCLKLIENEWWRNRDSVNYGICVQREGDSYDFWVAESYDESVTDFAGNQIEKFFKLAKAKNPLLNFVAKNIYYSSNDSSSRSSRSNDDSSASGREE